MIGRLMRMMQAGMALFVYFCAATVMAQVVVGAYIATNWQITEDRWHMMVAIAQGVDILEMKEEADREWEETSSEQVSMDQILDTRAGKYHDLELREQALRNDRSQLEFVKREVTDESRKYRMLREAFDTQLAELQAQTVAAGMDDNRTKLMAIKSPQAKQLLDEMLAKEEWDDVVTLLKGMPTTNSAKIIKEFKTPEDIERIGKVLRMIREGSPIVEKTEETRKQLNPPDAGQP